MSGMTDARAMAELRGLAMLSPLAQEMADHFAALLQRVADAEGQRDAAIAERDALVADARRYRWLRDPNSNVALVLDKATGWVEYHEGTQTGGYATYEYRAGEELDAAIDNALRDSDRAQEGKA